ncbi:hypothetical protein U1Q18_025529 [Sarracenia purpurea var. burkii]
MESGEYKEEDELELSADEEDKLKGPTEIPTSTYLAQWASLCNAFVVEAKWFAFGHEPKAEEYLKNGIITTGVHVVSVHMLFLLGDFCQTEESIELASANSEIITSTATILRLWNDLGSAKNLFSLWSAVPSNDENPALDAPSDVTGNENGAILARRLSSNSPQQVKSKGDHFSTAALSEMRSQGAAEIKSMDKGKNTDKMDEKSSQNVQKVWTLVLPPKKNKLVSGNDLRDGVRKQGRSGRGFTSTRSLMPMTVEKLGNVGTTKQLRSRDLVLTIQKAKQAGRQLGNFAKLMHVRSTLQSVHQQIFVDYNLR